MKISSHNIYAYFAYAFFVILYRKSLISDSLKNVETLGDLICLNNRKDSDFLLNSPNFW